MAIALITPVAGFLWGLVRVAQRSPANSLGYREWLATTPWKYGMALPRGPVRLNWVDAVVGVALSLAAWYVWRQIGPGFSLLGLLPAAATLLGATISLVYTSWKASQRFTAYAAVAAIPVVGLILPWNTVLVVGPLLAYAFGRIGVTRALKQFPWPEEASNLSVLGWPHGVMSHEPAEFLLPRTEALLLAGVGGVWIAWLAAMKAAYGNEGTEAANATAMAAVLVFYPAMFRVLRYLRVFSFDFRWQERIAKRRPLLPNDTVLLMPLAAVAATVVVGVALSSFEGAPASLCGGIAAAVGVYAVFALGPTVQQLHYTGNQELHPSATNVRYSSLVDLYE